jgi:hypothetical protein
MTEQVTDTHNTPPATEPLALRLSEGLGPNAQAVERWYCVSRAGTATLCVDGEDARANAAHCDKAWPAGGPHRAVLLGDAFALGKLRHALAQSGKLAEDRLQQMMADRPQVLRLRDQLDRALTVCRCAARVIDSSAYQGISDEDCDLEVAVRNWRALGPNVADKRAPALLPEGDARCERSA